MAGKTIPFSKATTMARDYTDYVDKLPVQPDKKTQYVSFTYPELMDYLAQVRPPVADEIRICLGIYPTDSTEPGRVTAIVWPYKDGRPATKPLVQGKDGSGDEEGLDPYNEGNSGP